MGADLDAEPTNGAGAVADAMRDMDAVHRRSLAGEPPEVEPAAAAWAAERLYGDASSPVFREVEAPEIEAGRSDLPCPDPGGSP